MIYLLLAMGFLLMGITFKPTWDWLKKDYPGQAPEPFIRHNGGFFVEKWLADEIKEMQVKLDLLTEAAGEINHRVSKVDTRLTPAQAISKESGFHQSLAKEKNSSLHQAIYRAFDEGKDVHEIAREFNRGKGEIELVLSLRKSGKT
ncbi:MAG: DUF6115 domain-containing protein [Bacillota bacterium]